MFHMKHVNKHKGLFLITANRTEIRHSS